ncbi:hypothetical protein NECID01_0501 [Nematocida sp. AWRm77]|nr:hypothetical protein NECID01_0501 [Nematocida sp. AWRm77]
MKLLERIALALSATEKEKERIAQEIDAYIKSFAMSKSPLIVVSSFIDETVREEEGPFEELSLEEKKSLIVMLNKRLAQINNTQEKVAVIANIVLQYTAQNVRAEKTGSFLHVLIGRLTEQIKAQVSANKSSALGYALFILRMCEAYPPLFNMYKKTLFKSILPLDYMLGMYRVYFTMLKESGNAKEAWEFISSLVNCTENVNNTFNPCVVNVFLDVMDSAMAGMFKQSWVNVSRCIYTEYLPLLNERFVSNIASIKTILSPYMKA